MTAFVIDDQKKEDLNEEVRILLKLYGINHKKREELIERVWRGELIEDIYGEDVSLLMTHLCQMVQYQDSFKHMAYTGNMEFVKTSIAGKTKFLYPAGALKIDPLSRWKTEFSFVPTYTTIGGEHRNIIINLELGINNSTRQSDAGWSETMSIYREVSFVDVDTKEILARYSYANDEFHYHKVSHECYQIFIDRSRDRYTHRLDFIRRIQKMQPWGTDYSLHTTPNGVELKPNAPGFEKITLTLI